VELVAKFCIALLVLLCPVGRQLLLEPSHSSDGIEATTNDRPGVFIGALTLRFSDLVLAPSGASATRRAPLNLGMIGACLWSVEFMVLRSWQWDQNPLISTISPVLGIHLRMAIGAADMPVDLASYSAVSPPLHLAATEHRHHHGWQVCGVLSATSCRNHSFIN